MSYSTNSYIGTPKEVPSYIKRLSICLTPNGFSFSRTAQQGILLTFGDVSMDMNRTMSELTSDLKAFFVSNDISPFDFEDMQLVIPSDQYVWIPKALFDESSKDVYLKSVFTLPDGYGCFSSYNESVEAYNVFAANTGIETAFKIVLPGIEVYSQSSILATPHLLDASAKVPVILLHQRQRMCDFLVCKDGKMLLSSSYEVSSDEERLFRALELMKGLQVEDHQMTLFICGDVDRNTYESLCNYFPQIRIYSGRPLGYKNPEFQVLRAYQHVLVLS
ncbi:MAG: DUF3822 family protein [Bacteroidales bacterium]|nr:DUF3822 family protein [Bacteroidales bacterium]